MAIFSPDFYASYGGAQYDFVRRDPSVVNLNFEEAPVTLRHPIMMGSSLCFPC
jgi:hypothetical protein